MLLLELARWAEALRRVVRARSCLNLDVFVITAVAAPSHLVVVSSRNNDMCVTDSKATQLSRKGMDC